MPDELYLTSVAVQISSLFVFLEARYRRKWVVARRRYIDAEGLVEGGAGGRVRWIYH